MKRQLFFAISAGLLSAWGCAPSTNFDLAHEPHIVVKNANWESISVAIAEFNMAKGRKLDLVRPNELILYEARHLPDSAAHHGSEQIVGKIIYDYEFLPDSVIITSHRYWTHDLDDTTIAEAVDTATVDAEQQELSEIARSIQPLVRGGELAVPASTR